MINPTFLRSPNAGVWIVPNDRGEIAEARIHIRDGALNARMEAARSLVSDLAAAEAERKSRVATAKEASAALAVAKAEATKAAKGDDEGAKKEAADAVARAEEALATANFAERGALGHLEDARRKAASAPTRITTPAQLDAFAKKVPASTRFVLCGPGSATSVCDLADWLAAAREVVRPEAA